MAQKGTILVVDDETGPRESLRMTSNRCTMSIQQQMGRRHSNLLEMKMSTWSLST